MFWVMFYPLAMQETMSRSHDQMQEETVAATAKSAIRLPVPRYMAYVSQGKLSLKAVCESWRQGDL